MGLDWEKVEKSVNDLGTTITYQAKGTQLVVQSRKRKVPHTNRPGFWWHTSYFVLYNGNEMKEKQTLAEAKAYGETLVGRQ